MTSQSSRSAGGQRNIWEHRLGIHAPEQISEQQKYWDYRNVYHPPVPKGIELSDSEDKERWETINLGGLGENGANRQVERTRAQQFVRARERENRQNSQEKNAVFLISVICFGMQIILAIICIGLCIHRIFYHAQIQAGIAFLILAIIPLIGAAGGIFAALMGSKTIALGTAIYNVASAVGVIVAAINLYSFRAYQPYPVTAFIPLAAAVGTVQANF
ncbi:unnamed protein product [Acanthocheilonema viteae]|uniref:Uncharacterized protein n=1 Tax=Acanthocheilonema viteae TaxID=6277 RepID=A0A498SS20_ACAVI|nr:unnamed protein product [Acanthocheilonema viteae]